MINTPSMTEQELARAVANDGRAVFNEVVRRYCKPLTLFALCRVATFQDAEDIVQETFLRSYQRVDSFDSKYPLKSWLFTIAYRLIVSEHRKKRPQRLTDEAASVLESNEAKECEWSEIWHAASKLGSEATTVLWLRYKEEMTAAEIARVMKKTTIAVRVLLHRSRNRLAKVIVNTPEFAERLPWPITGDISVERRNP